MDTQRIIETLRAIPSEFHHNDYATRAIAVAIKRIKELENADIPADSITGLLADSESPRQQETQ